MASHVDTLDSQLHLSLLQASASPLHRWEHEALSEWLRDLPRVVRQERGANQV